MKINKLILFLLVFSLSFNVAHAICPACTVAVAGGLGVSRWLGIDDFVTSLWIGGLSLSMTAWSWSYLKRKGIMSVRNAVIVFLIFYSFVLVPLYWMDLIGIVGNTLWGIDKIILGTVIGTIVFWIGAYLHFLLKKRNGNKVYFPFQKVVIPFTILLIFSLIINIFI